MSHLLETLRWAGLSDEPNLRSKDGEFRYPAEKAGVFLTFHSCTSILIFTGYRNARRIRQDFS